MKFILIVLLLMSAVCSNFALQLEKPAKAIQIVSPLNHTFKLNEDELKGILEDDLIKDRNLVIISIVGAYRQGKSFMLNFFLEYLYAQVS